MKELEAKFELLFRELRVIDSKKLVDETIKPIAIKKDIPGSIV